MRRKLQANDSCTRNLRVVLQCASRTQELHQKELAITSEEARVSSSSSDPTKGVRRSQGTAEVGTLELWKRRWAICSLQPSARRRWPITQRYPGIFLGIPWLRLLGDSFKGEVATAFLQFGAVVGISCGRLLVSSGSVAAGRHCQAADLRYRVFGQTVFMGFG